MFKWIDAKLRRWAWNFASYYLARRIYECWRDEDNPVAILKNASSANFVVENMDALVLQIDDPELNAFNLKYLAYRSIREMLNDLTSDMSDDISTRIEQRFMQLYEAGASRFHWQIYHSKFSDSDIQPVESFSRALGKPS